MSIGSVFTAVIDTTHRGPPPTPPPPPPGQRIAGRYVFSNYMCYHYTYGGDGFSQALGDPVWIGNYQREILEAQASGIDGWELDYIDRADLFNSVSNIFEAAKRIWNANTAATPFWLFMSPELGFPGSAAGTFAGTGRNWIEYFVSTFKNHPCYFRYQSKWVIGSFLGPDNPSNQGDLTNVFNNLAGQGAPVFFVPFLFNGNGITTDGLHLTTWGQANLGSVRFWPGNTTANDLASMDNIANICATNGLPLIGAVGSGSYWSTNTSASAGVYFERDGGEGPAAEWVHLIAKNPAWVVEAVWNDWTEAYTAWRDIPGESPTIVSGYPYDYLCMPHRGYAQQRKYYAQWYLTGVQPAITTDLLIAFYRTMSQANTNHSGPGIAPVTWVGTILDVIYVQTFLTAPATLRVNTGGNITNYSLSSGINFTRTPFAPGAQIFSLIRGALTIATVTGVQIQGSTTNNNAHIATCYASPSVHYP